MTASTRKPSTDTAARLWKAAGWACLGLALAGLAVPIVPQVPFAIAAAYCFSRGSPRLHAWLRKRPRLGPPVRAWEDHGVVSPKLKALSTAAMLTGAAFAFLKFHEETPWLAYALPGLFAIAVAFVLSRPSRAPRKPNRHSHPKKPRSKKRNEKPATKAA